MSFTQPVFFLFLPVVVALYWLLPGRFRWMLLLAASYFFYMYWNPILVILLLISTLVDYFCSLGIDDHPDDPKKKKIYLALSIIMNLGLLFSFKYLDFFGQTVNGICRLLSIPYSVPAFDLILPVGISFYTFQTMSYTFDVYRGTVKAERHFGHYALFVTFFPQLVAGPIERPGDLLPQLKQHLHLRREDLLKGAQMLLRGYGKKVLIADFLAGFVDNVYGQVKISDGSALAVATVFFAFQIYCDFSGYSDIAQGCSHLLGIRLSDNFRRPYAATSIRDFWRRWHTSLTGWFTDYLYIPLGGSRVGTIRTCVNILITFLVSGLWHGANWTFVIWGGLHGLYLVLERLLCRKRSIGTIPTFLAVCFAWIFFRAATVADAFTAIRHIFSLWDLGQLLPDLGMTATELLAGLLMTALLPFLDRLPKLEPGEKLPSSALSYYFLILAMVCCRILVLTQHGETAFIYFQF